MTRARLTLTLTLHLRLTSSVTRVSLEIDPASRAPRR